MCCYGCGSEMTEVCGWSCDPGHDAQNIFYRTILWHLNQVFATSKGSTPSLYFFLGEGCRLKVESCSIKVELSVYRTIHVDTNYSKVPIPAGLKQFWSIHTHHSLEAISKLSLPPPPRPTCFSSEILILAGATLNEQVVVLDLPWHYLQTAMSSATIHNAIKMSQSGQ